MWNLMPLEGLAIHTSIHGKGVDAFNLIGKFWHGTPRWFKGTLGSYPGRGAMGISEYLFGEKD